LTDIVIPDSVTTIESGAFEDSHNIKTVTFGNNVTYIGPGAFRSCDEIETITLPDSMTYIGYQAFYACFSLTSINIPKNVTFIGSQAFHACDGLTSVTFETTSGWWMTKDELNTSGDSISSSDIASPSAAVTALTQKYVDYTWKRN
jgi:hypothetical protein